MRSFCSARIHRQRKVLNGFKVHGGAQAERVRAAHGLTEYRLRETGALLSVVLQQIQLQKIRLSCQDVVPLLIELLQSRHVMECVAIEILSVRRGVHPESEQHPIEFLRMAFVFR